MAERRRCLTEDAQPGADLPGRIAKALKIVLRDAKPAEYRFDYVTFPKELPRRRASTPAERAFPRGWLSAAVYRHEQYRLGRASRVRPEPRSSREPKAHPARARPSRWSASTARASSIG